MGAFICRRGGEAVKTGLIVATSGSVIEDYSLVGVKNARLDLRNGGVYRTGRNLATAIGIENGEVSYIFYANSERYGMNMDKGTLPVFDPEAGTITCQTTSEWSELFTMNTSSGNVRYGEYEYRIS